MLPYRALILTVMLAASPAWAYQKAAQQNAQPGLGDSKNPNPAGLELAPRTPLPKYAYVSKPLGESRLVIKFRDEVKARVQQDQTVKLTAAPTDSAPLNTITQQFNLKFVKGVNGSEAKLAALEARVAAYSGRAQPDLAGLMYIEGPEDRLEAAANALNNLDIVEFVYFQEPWKVYHPQDSLETGGQPEGPPPTGACCLPALPPNPTCDDVTFDTQAECDFVGGIFFEGNTCALLPVGCPPVGACCTFQVDTGDWGCSEVFSTAPPDSAAFAGSCEGIGGVFVGGECQDADCNFDCGDDVLASCFEEHGYPFCNDEDCCDIVIERRPECGTGEWDFICVAFANMYCTTPPGEPDRCVVPFNQSCFIPHIFGGCLDTDCCHNVCDIDPFCCTGQWDAVCVSYAWQLCEPPGGGATPDMTSAQGYLRASSWETQFQGPPPPTIPPVPPPPPTFLPGFGGEGMDLFAEGPIGGPNVRWIDDPNMPAPDRYRGLYGLGRELHEVYGAGTQNQARGATIKVAVIEWAFYQNHEDLDVIPEPGQTMIMIPDITEPDHATACLGIINALDNGFGMVGVAPDAQAYFFPLTSVEEGPREFTAFVNCIDTLDPGDVISCSFGPPNSLANEIGSWMLIRFAADLDITVCIAAANACRNLTETADNLGEHGGILVGACTPGAPYCREWFSNFFRTEADEHDSRMVHVSAWGSFVASTGYGDLFWGGSPERAYTISFGGTSAATPQVAGVVACLQGLAKQFYNIPLPCPQPDPTDNTNTIREALRGGGFPQCGIGDNSDLLPGTFDDFNCIYDTNPDAPGNRIGPYVRPRVSANLMLNQPSLGFDASPMLQEIFIMRGVPGFGNKFSVKASDDTYFVMRSLFTDRNHVPTLSTHDAEANYVSSKATYIASGYHADLLVKLRSPVKQAGQMTVAVEVNTSAPFSLLMVEAFDWQLDRWAFVGFQFPLPAVPQGDEAQIGYFASPGTRFIHPTSRNAWLRVYALSIGSQTPDLVFAGPNPDIGSVYRFDYIGAGFSGGFAQPIE